MASIILSEKASPLRCSWPSNAFVATDFQPGNYRQETKALCEDLWKMMCIQALNRRGLNDHIVAEKQLPGVQAPSSNTSDSNDITSIAARVGRQLKRLVVILHISLNRGIGRKNSALDKFLLFVEQWYQEFENVLLVMGQEQQQFKLDASRRPGTPGTNPDLLALRARLITCA